MKLFTIILIVAALIIPSKIAADDVVQKYKALNAKYLEYIKIGEFDSALEVALELNAMDPADTRALLYIVFACVKAGKAIPKWVLEEPWPDATDKDIFNRQLAEQLSKGT